MKINCGSAKPRVARVGCGCWGRNQVRNFHDLGVLATAYHPSVKVLNLFETRYPNCQFFTSYQEISAHHTSDAAAIATSTEVRIEMVHEV